MKKFLFLSLFAMISVLMVSCNRDNDDQEKTETLISVKVQKNGTAQSGVTVYMFDESSNKVGFFKPFFAKKSVVTDDNGVATFRLQEVFDLNVISSQTTLYFGVFENDTVLGRTGTTVDKGKNKTITISLK